MNADHINENAVLVIYALILWIKVFMKMQLISISGPLFAVL
jgi:hypothetical protein